jgi:tRNA threonylcarbamoyladenosine modification (KEOPS) complex  Pcc1 subunit
MATVSSELPFQVQISVPFPSATEALIVYNSLRVDKDPKTSTATKSLSVKDNRLIAILQARNAKHLRVSVTSFFEFVLLSCRTIQRFGPVAN